MISRRSVPLVVGVRGVMAQRTVFLAAAQMPVVRSLLQERNAKVAPARIFTKEYSTAAPASGEAAKVAEVCPAGKHQARLASVIDYGWQKYTFNQKEGSRKRVRLDFDVFANGKTYYVGREFTNTTSAMGQLRPFLESWGKSLPEKGSIDFKSMIGQPATVEVTQNTGKSNNQVYANLQSISAASGDVPAAKRSAYFAVGEGHRAASWDAKAFEALPEWQKARVKESLDYDRVATSAVPEGRHLGRCVQVVQLGMHTSSFQGKTKESPRVRIVFELTTLANAPLVHRDFTLSIAPASNLKAFLEKWSIPVQDRQADMKQLLGKAAAVTVARSTSKDSSKSYTQVTTVEAAPDNTVPPAKSEQLIFSIAPFDEKTFEKLTQYTKNFIQKSSEFKKRANPSQ